MPVAVGMRNWTPLIKDALDELIGAGVTRVIGIPLAPQFSTLSVQKYVAAATAALGAVGALGTSNGVQLDPIEAYFSHPALIEAFADRVNSAQPKPDELVVFTAHALPTRVIEAGDPHVSQVAATAPGGARRAGIGRF